MSDNKRFKEMYKNEWDFVDTETRKPYSYCDCINLLNELNDEKDWLEMNNKDLVSFIKSKGYTLNDFLKYVGQFSSVGVNKEDWND